MARAWGQRHQLPSPGPTRSDPDIREEGSHEVCPLVEHGLVFIESCDELTDIPCAVEDIPDRSGIPGFRRHR